MEEDDEVMGAGGARAGGGSITFPTVAFGGRLKTC